MKNLSYYLAYIQAFVCCMVSNVTFGQQSGELDTTFRTRANYGALFPIEKAWALADGSTLCFREGANYFSGKKTGSFFKIKPDGELDTTYKSPQFEFHCLLVWCYCHNHPQYFLVDKAGKVVLLTGGIVIVDGVLSDNINFRISETGHVDTQINQLHFSTWEVTASPELADGRVVNWFSDSLVVYNADIQRDTSFVPFGLGPEYSYISAVLRQSTDRSYLVFVKIGFDKVYLPLLNGANSFGTPIVPGRINGQVPEPIEADVFGRIYELYPWADTIQGKIYDRIVRRNSNGLIDSSYSILMVKVPSPGTSSSFIPNRVWVDSLGRIHQSLEGGLERRYDALTGATSDTVFAQEPGIITVRHENQLISLGHNQWNRWSYVRKNLGDSAIVNRYTRFGANGPVQKVLTDSEKKAVILGQFSDFDGHKTPMIARVQHNGSVDSGFVCSAFNATDAQKVIVFDFWRGDPAQGLLVVFRKPSGSLNRYAYHVLHDGRIDSGFAQNGFGSVGLNLQELIAGQQRKGGDIYLTARVMQGSDSSKSYLFRLQDSGSFDADFTPKSIQHYFPSFININFWRGPYLQAISRVDENKLLIASRLIYNLPDPPCKTESNIYYSWMGLILDSNGVAQDDPAWTIGTLQTCEAPSLNRTVVFGYANRDIFPGPEQNTYLLTPDLQIDTTFRLRKPNGSIDFYPQTPLLVTQKGDYLFSNLKTNGEGLLDSSFYFKTWPSSIAEPDTAHLYLGGNFQLFGPKVAPYLVRIHHKTSVVTSLRPEWKRSLVSLYPNPVQDAIQMNGWAPGTQLKVTTVQGKVLFNAPVESQFSADILPDNQGVYFWTAYQNGRPVGGGRLIR